MSYDYDNQRDTNDVHVLEVGKSEKKAMENIANTKTQRHKDTTDRYNNEEERSNRRHKHINSGSKSNISDVVKQELKKMREMIQRIPGVPKPQEQATPTIYVNSLLLMALPW